MKRKTNTNAICPLCRDLKPLDNNIRIEHNVYFDDKLCIPYLCKSCYNMLNDNHLTVMFESIRNNEDLSITGNHLIVKKKDPHLIMYVTVKDFKKQSIKRQTNLN